MTDEVINYKSSTCVAIVRINITTWNSAHNFGAGANPQVPMQEYMKTDSFGGPGNKIYTIYIACSLTEWVAFLHTAVMATVVMCRVRNPSLHCHRRPWEGALYKWLTRSAYDAMHMALYK